MKAKLTLIKLLLVLVGLGALASVNVTAEQTHSLVSQSVNHVGHFLDDTTVTANVKAAILDDKKTQVSSLSVNTDHGKVTVSGFVSSLEEKTRLQRLSENIPGVRQLDNQLRVRHAKGSSVRVYASDVATTSEAIMRLLIDKQITTRHLHVTTRHGEVFLTGSIPTQLEKQQAGKLVQGISGVQKVKNELKVVN
ncbi:BON domain-containing protein [Rosenbergiella collisarenosi]|uniref:BON domain-containing protein n=1 Tax=Rosenbergiella collisarenosi TaxID=1544695 RepID=UPI001BDB5F90|nr:BON domain-containing protein [Rosenbergiella collisarenosi]MBT0721310.1 BON domain-containing protein [Rosenbergiella collisarenosi]